MSQYITNLTFAAKCKTPTIVFVKRFLDKFEEIEEWTKIYKFRGYWTFKVQGEYEPNTLNQFFDVVFMFENERDAFDFKLRFV